MDWNGEDNVSGSLPLSQGPSLQSWSMYHFLNEIGTIFHSIELGSRI